MKEPRTFHVGNSREKYMAVLSRLSSLLITPEDDLEIEVRPRRKDKTPAQRGLFHALCQQFGNEVGLTKGQVKEAVKVEHFGIDQRVLPSGKVYNVTESSESADRTDYSALIETLLRMAAENGVLLDERAA